LLRRLPYIIIYSVLIAISLQDAGSFYAHKNTEDTNEVYLPVVQSSSDQAPTIEWIGPGGGTIGDLIFDPVNTDTAYAAASTGGVYKSIDGGLTWQKINKGIENLDVTAIGIAPTDPDEIYAGTYRGGLYKWDDEGENWTRSDTGFQDSAITYSIEIDPDQANRVFVSTRGLSTNHHAPWNGVVYRSENAGESWTEVLTNVGGSSEEDWAYDLSIHPENTDIIFAATHEHGAYRSENQGDSWSAINTGVTDTTARAIEHDPSSTYKGEAYLGVFERTGMFKSSNGGDNWTLFGSGLSDARIYKLSIDPDNTDIIYTATFGDGVMKTTNGGSSWGSSGLDEETILDVVVKPGEHQVLLSGTVENGLFRSTDSGGSWSHNLQGLNASTVTSMVLRPEYPLELVAALYPGWIARSTDGGETWGDYHEGISDHYVNRLVTHPTLPNIVYALTESSGLYMRDTEGTENWWHITSSFPDSVPTVVSEWQEPEDGDDNLGDFLFPKGIPSSLQQKALSSMPPLLSMAFALTDPLTAYMGTDGSGVYKSDDDGDTWTYSGLTGKDVRDLVVSPSDPTWVYAATNAEGAVYRTPNGGTNWENLLLSGVTAYSLAIHPSNPGLVYAGTTNGVYQHDGSVWTAAGLAGFKVFDIAIHPDNTSTLYAGTNNSALVSYDGGLNWEVVTDVLMGIKIESVEFDALDSDVIYFTTDGHGVMRVEN